MNDRMRMLLVAGPLALLVVATTPGVATQAPAAAPWKIGDLFAGVGVFGQWPGTYVVLDPTGMPTGQILVDPSAGNLEALTTGCTVDFDVQGEALFGTTFSNRSLVRFDAEVPHTPVTAVSLPTSSNGASASASCMRTNRWRSTVIRPGSITWAAPDRSPTRRPTG